jgi:hypothetical protein
MSYSVDHAWSLICCWHVRIFHHFQWWWVLKISDVDLKENHLWYDSKEWRERLNELSWMLKDLTQWSENYSQRHI